MDELIERLEMIANLRMTDPSAGIIALTAKQAAAELRRVRESPVAHVAELKDGRMLISFEEWADDAWIASTERVRLVPERGEVSDG